MIYAKVTFYFQVYIGLKFSAEQFYFLLFHLYFQFSVVSFLCFSQLHLHFTVLTNIFLFQFYFSFSFNFSLSYWAYSYAKC